MVEELDRNLSHFADIAEKTLGRPLREREGSGATGGLGASLMGFLNAELKRGIEIVLEAVDFEEAVKEANLVITGEGRIDSQTICGKTPIGVAKAYQKARGSGHRTCRFSFSGQRRGL